MTDPPSAPTPSPGSQPTSLTLLHRLRGQEPDAWRVMVELYAPLVQRWCQRNGVRGADADDVAQEVFRSVASHLDQFRRDRPGDSFRGWLRTITRNAALLYLRRNGKEPKAGGGTEFGQLMRELPDVTPVDEPEDTAERGALTARAVELIRGEFEESTFHMFWRTAVDGRAPADVAADLGVTPAAVRKAKSRVLHRLKALFADVLD